MQIALAGIGKIAIDQHVPALSASEDWELAATVSRSGTVDGVDAFDSLGADLFKAAGDTFSMTGELYRYTGTGFDEVTAHGDNGGQNTLDIDAVDFLFNQEGDWEG